jgi:hypothetical protein
MSQPGQQAQTAPPSVRKSRWKGFMVFGVIVTALLIAFQLTHYFNPKWMPLYSSSILDWTAYFVGLAALIMAIKTDSGVSDALDGIEIWAKAMTTRSVGPFPGHLDAISELIDGTRNEGTLDIIADCADYGSFYDPKSYKKLQAAIATASSRNVKIRYVVCGRLHRFTANSPYFGKKISKLATKEKNEFLQKLRHFFDLVRSDEPFLDKLRSCSESSAQLNLLVRWLTDNTDATAGTTDWHDRCNKFLQLFCGSGHTPPSAEPFESEQMLDLLLFVREWFNEDAFRCVATLRRDPRTAPLFMWLRDAKTNAEAVFVLPSPITQGFGFKTRDPILISSFSSTFDHYWQPPPTT